MMERSPDVRHVDTDSMHYRLGWLAVVGLGLIVIGLSALYAPYYLTFSLQDSIGIFFLINGGMFIADAFKSRQDGRFVPEFFIALLYLSFAVLVLAAAEKVETLTAFLSIFFCLEGVLKIQYSLGLRTELDWKWVLISGVLSVIIGAAVWGIPYGSPLLSVMVGLDQLHGGLTTIIVARSMRRMLESREILCIRHTCFSS
jgi:uncharacterized membrane protein HdeD (DUF308 family)